MKVLIDPRVYDDLPAGQALELRALEQKICTSIQALDVAMPSWRTDPCFEPERRVLAALDEAVRRLKRCAVQTGQPIGRIAL